MDNPWGLFIGTNTTNTYIYICIYARAYIYIHIRNARLATQVTARNSARDVSGSVSVQRSPASMVKFSRIVAVRTFVRPTHTGTAAELYMQYFVLKSALVLVYIYVAMCADDQVSRCCVASGPTYIYICTCDTNCVFVQLHYIYMYLCTYICTYI
jgi:hypothetical protein